MKIKRYFAPDMRQAIRRVREEQGPDAVILSNRKVEGGVEIVAAVDYDEGLVRRSLLGEDAAAGADIADTVDAPTAPSAATTGRDAAPRPRPEVASGEPAAAGGARASAAGEARNGSGIYWVQDPGIVAMRQELNELRHLLEHQLARLAWGEYTRNHPLRADLLRRLTGLGLEHAHARDLIEDVTGAEDLEQAWRQCLGLLAGSLSVTEDDILSDGGVVALVGPTGVGKTTTVAKLAARFALRHGQRHVALVTTDSYRIGAHEQLVTYGRILGVPVQVAGTAEELATALKSLVDKRLVLIDTAGMSQRDLRLTEQFQTLRAAGAPVRNYLVLSATTQSSVLEEAVRAFGDVALHGSILTKLDEATSLGGALSVLARHQLPMAYVGDGQRVPEDMHPARPHNLVHRATELAKQIMDLPEDETVAEQFGRMVANAHV